MTSQRKGISSKIISCVVKLHHTLASTLFSTQPATNFSSTVFSWPLTGVVVQNTRNRIDNNTGATDPKEKRWKMRQKIENPKRADAKFSVVESWWSTKKQHSSTSSVSAQLTGAAVVQQCTSVCSTSAQLSVPLMKHSGRGALLKRCYCWQMDRCFSRPYSEPCGKQEKSVVGTSSLFRDRFESVLQKKWAVL